MLYFLKNDYLSIELNSLGAELMSIKNLKNNNTEYLWQADPTYWAGKSPNLFPIVGRIKNDGNYYYQGKNYTIKSPHGFTKISELTCVEQTENTIIFNLKSNNETMKVYPFEFDFKIKYELIKNKLNITYIVENIGEKTLIFAVGAHPGFNIPINDGEKFEDYFIEFENICTPNEVICDNCFITGDEKPFKLENDKKLTLNHNLFDNDAIILSKLNSKKLCVKSNSSKNYIAVQFDDFEYLGIWHKPLSDAPYICIEPWNGLPSGVASDENFETKEPMLKLDPSKTYNASYSIEIF